MMGQLQRLAKGASIAAALGFAMLAQTPVAKALVITNNSSDWKFVPGSVTATGGIWGLPANLSGVGCGTENETSCEQVGNFTFDQKITATPGYFTILDPNGTISDYVLFSNNGPGGNGQILLYSDPNLSPNLAGFTNDGVLCTEGSVQGGCIGTFALVLADLSVLTISPASDGEIVFDPFGFGFDTSDDVKFACTGPCTLQDVPEPASLGLLGIALFGFAALRRRRKARNHSA